MIFESWMETAVPGITMEHVSKLLDKDIPAEVIGDQLFFFQRGTGIYGYSYCSVGKKEGSGIRRYSKADASSMRFRTASTRWSRCARKDKNIPLPLPVSVKAEIVKTLMARLRRACKKQRELEELTASIIGDLKGLLGSCTPCSDVEIRDLLQKALGDLETEEVIL